MLPRGIQFRAFVITSTLGDGRHCKPPLLFRTWKVKVDTLEGGGLPPFSPKPERGAGFGIPYSLVLVGERPGFWASKGSNDSTKKWSF